LPVVGFKWCLLRFINVVYVYVVGFRLRWWRHRHLCYQCFNFGMHPHRKFFRWFILTIIYSMLLRFVVNRWRRWIVSIVSIVGFLRLIGFNWQCKWFGFVVVRFCIVRLNVVGFLGFIDDTAILGDLARIQLCRRCVVVVGKPRGRWFNGSNQRQRSNDAGRIMGPVWHVYG
jgi:hypothetical protein